MTAVILDTETTGMNDPEPVETAWRKVILSDGKLAKGIWARARWKPSKPIELGAMATHHILDEHLADLPPASGFKLPEGVEYIIGHNIDYDWGVVGRPEMKRICTLAMARALWPALDSHKLGALLYHVRRENARGMLIQEHSALTDVLNCFVVLEEILARNPHILDMESLHQYSETCRIPTHMPFGKYKGWLIADVPRDYVSWYLRQVDIDLYLVKAFQKTDLA